MIARRLACSLIVTALSFTAAAAQSWPERPVTMIVPFAAGSASDTVGRILAARLGDVLGQQVVIENMGGAGGTIGTGRAARATPDGYQFILGGIDTFAMSKALYKKLPYDPVADFVPVALVAEQPIVLLVRKDLPAKDLKEFIAYGKANPGKLQYGSAGVGSGSHLACAQLFAAAGIEGAHVPYRGSAPAMQDVIAGRLDGICALGAAALPQITSGTVRPLAILSKERSPLLPDLASASEQGLKDFDAPFWSAFFVPKGTPDAVVKKLNAAALDLMNTPSSAEALKKVGTTFVAADRRSPEYLQKFLDSEIAKWAAIIKASGVTLD
ncbi:tripartite tricarboxylate transporter substrate binding protein BugD [Pseudolabrys taiwanensis]|uniref:Tripartite tricarboxylate transporter substrate binding protein BugD n=1 Tax=Pseudolabrys taiwanensis TaxID=331696 RepID=A0A345ZU68_9HYPH|nr:tripartite tricarboxylate transporter substrate-binding protein [Pseudolabrys taiwanensis]AXK80465.1 tripartite tricarboxylate transporter substrate binding protein BugD [Pseudolabrys taiwanensis]